MRKVLIDAHTHTVASGHAYSSLQEMVRAAADKGLEILGITEHGPSVPGTCPLVYFRNMFVVPRQMYGIRLLMGCEVNILDNQGNLDLNDEYLDRLDIAIAGIHGNCWQGVEQRRKIQKECSKSSVILKFILSAIPEMEQQSWILNDWYWLQRSLTVNQGVVGSSPS